MAAPPLETVMLAIANQLEAGLNGDLGEIQVYHMRLLNPTPPCIDIYPADPFHEQIAMGHANRELHFMIRARVSSADSDSGQSLLLALLNADGSSSVLAALATDRTLQGWVDDSSVEAVSGFAMHQDVAEAQPLLGCTWRLKVEL